MAALLGQVGRREVDGDAFGGQGDGHFRKRRAHAVTRFAHCFVGQAHDGKRRQAGGEGALYLDRFGLDPKKGDCLYFGYGHIAPPVARHDAGALFQTRLRHSWLAGG